MDFADVKKLTVKHDGRTVGWLADLDGRIAFQYDDEWRTNGFSISPFSLPLSDRIFVCEKRTFDGLFGVFHDSLPDGWGELLFRRMAARRGVDADGISPLTRLSLVGESGLGGLRYEPDFSETSEEERRDLDALAREAEKIVEDRDSDADLDEIYRLGGSSGGARPKAHLRIEGESWIVKFPCSLDGRDAGLREFEANALARKAGLRVNDFRLFPSRKCSGFFGAKRFDRRGDASVHMVSLSSLLETSHRIPNLDYAHLLQVIERICVDKSDLYEAFGRMCFNVFFGNKDDHGRNFAFLHDERDGGYRLSPAYDITRTTDKVEHEMAVNGNGNPSEEDMLAVAADSRLDMDRCRKIMARVKAALAR